MGNTTKGKPTKGTGTTVGKGTGGVQFTYTPPPKVTPHDRKGSSTVGNPVGVSWVTCLMLVHNNKGVLPQRSTLHQGCYQQGVCYNTTRTQVQRFWKWYNGGCNPTELPKGVTIPKGCKLTPTTP